MVRAYGELMLWLISNIPTALGEFMPLCMAGAALSIVTYMIKRVLRRGLG